MTILRIEHPVPDVVAWKRAFDHDPVDRKGAGVRRYQIMQPTDDAHHVVIDLELDSPDQAERLLARLRELWARVEGTVMTSPRARIFQVTERREL